MIDKVVGWVSIMAQMIPDINPISIKNEGERRVYQALLELPDDFTVCYSFKYHSNEYDKSENLYEIDFVILHPELGYVTVEVKQGYVLYQDKQWYEFKNNDYHPMSKDPFEQASKSMYAILDKYKEKTNQTHFPLKIRYALCFPEAQQLEGELPAELDVNSLWFFDDIEDIKKLQSKLTNLFTPLPEPSKKAINDLKNKVLAPSFKIYNLLEQEIEQFNQTSEQILTDEQERILEETSYDKRKIFFGSAGTGKTFLAMEKARHLQRQGKNVFVTCYNRNLSKYLAKNLPDTVCVQTIHDHFLTVARQKDAELVVPQEPSEKQEFFSTILPMLAFDVIAEYREKDLFDSIIIDEGQDFKQDWFECIDAMLKPDGELYIFADPDQSIFSQDIDKIKGIKISKHRLIRNMRNTQETNNWMQFFLSNTNLKCLNNRGLPVVSIPCDKEEQIKILEKEIGRLISQGVQLKRITILAPHSLAKSSLAGKERIKEWPLADNLEESGNKIRYCTIRSFKGLEAEIVFLIDIDSSLACQDADIYVGGSRARFLLYILHDRNIKI